MRGFDGLSGRVGDEERFEGVIIIVGSSSGTLLRLAREGKVRGLEGAGARNPRGRALNDLCVDGEPRAGVDVGRRKYRARLFCYPEP